MRLAVALVLLLLLAGCSSPAKGGDEDVVGPDIVLDPGSGLGAIGGVVIDEAIRPIAGATIELQGSGRTATSDAGGQFVFEDLAPGGYFLIANATGHAQVQTSTEVQAGSVARVKLLMPIVTGIQPYAFTLAYHGFIQASGAVTGPLVNIIVEGFTGSNPMCTCSLAFNTTGHDVKTLVVEAVWDDTTDPPTGPSTLYLEVFPAELDDGTRDIQGGFLASPILQHYPIDMWGENETNTDWHARLTGDAFSVQVNQPYDLFVTVFANAPAPEGWSLVKGDQVP